MLTFGFFLIALQNDFVFAQPCCFRDGKRALGAAPASGGGAPSERLLELLAAAGVADDERGGVGARQPEALQRGGAQEVLHGYRLACAQQRAIQHGVRDFVGLRGHIGGHVKAPVFNAALPVRPGEGKVLTAFGGGSTRADKVAVGVFVVANLVLARARLRRNAFQARHAQRVSARRGHLLAAAVAHAHRRAFHGLAFVQRRHPRERAFAPELEMHAQIGDEHAGAHHHAALRAVAIIQQRAPQFVRGEFQHLKPGLQRHAHHFKRALTGLCRLASGHFHGLHAALAGKQREHARLHHVFHVLFNLFGRGRGQGSADEFDSVFARHPPVLKRAHAPHPVHHLGVAGQHQRRKLQARLRLHAPQRDGQQRRVV